MSDDPADGQVEPPPAFNVWVNTTEDSGVHYMVTQPWQWVMDDITDGSEHMSQVTTVADLPSSRLAAQAVSDVGATPNTRRRRRFSLPKQRIGPVPSTLKIEIYDPTSEQLLFAAHGSSSALDGLEDKDELVRTMQRCRCEDKHITPPSVLLNWDVTHEECLKLVGAELPTLPGNVADDRVAVLKEPMGSQGNGVFFVKTADDIDKIVTQHRQRAQDEPNYLDNLIKAKGRIPSWVLQAEVTPSLLIRGRRKFHIRTYVVVVEKLWLPDEVVGTYVYGRHEVRVAGVPVAVNSQDRDRAAHITNGALSDKTERLLLDDVEELARRGVKDKLELFVATAFGRDFVKDIVGRVLVSAREDPKANTIQKFAVAGLDLMVTEDNRIYLLEVNVNPAAPSRETISESFKEHLRGFFRDIADLVAGNKPPNFVSAAQIMANHGIET